MKDLIKKINESTNTNVLFKEVHYESEENYEYHTYDFKNGKKSLKYGFVVFNEDSESVSTVAFNKPSDYFEGMGLDDDFEDLKDIQIGEAKYINNDTWMRIW